MRHVTPNSQEYLLQMVCPFTSRNLNQNLTILSRSHFSMDDASGFHRQNSVFPLPTCIACFSQIKVAVDLERLAGLEIHCRQKLNTYCPKGFYEMRVYMNVLVKF